MGGQGMPYVFRDGMGQIIGIHDQDGSEFLASDHPEVQAFAQRQLAAGGAPQFLASDLAFIRVIEDLVEALVNKGVLNLSDLPGPAQDKLLSRRSMRGHLSGIAGLYQADGGGKII